MSFVYIQHACGTKVQNSEKNTENKRIKILNSNPSILPTTIKERQDISIYITFNQKKRQL